MTLAGIEATRTLVLPELGPRPVVAVVAAGAALALHLHHLAYGLRGRRPPRGAMTLSLLAAVHVGAAVTVGDTWLLNRAALPVSTLLVVPWPRSLFPYAAVLLATWLLASGNGLAPTYYVLSVAWRSTTLVVLVLLVAAIHQLDVTREVQREHAVVVERGRISNAMAKTGARTRAEAARMASDAGWH